ncbi:MULTISPECIES: HEPN domain-containing protein [unclassified Fusobacterium]|uniref:HEPN domain-containing protein n=1 Tax=unclassified Fusobacterium TaxID=2648384 RepID=UPI001B8A8D24|nr:MULTISPECIES: HEPN domain-containing protein [unclassified Fusobacterium]
MSVARKLSSPERFQNTKSQKDIRVNYKTWRNDLKESFVENLDIIKKLQDRNIQDVMEICRMQISLLMSLYDYTIHEIVRYKMVDIYEGVAEKSRQYDFFKVSMRTLQEAINEPEKPLSWLLRGVSFQNDTISYINPKKTLEALSFVTDRDMFEEYCKDSGKEYSEFFSYLAGLNSRRNQIVHSMDIKNKRTLERNDITQQETEEILSTVRELVIYLIEKI